MKYTSGSSGSACSRRARSAATRPSASPNAVPTTPIMIPCARKIRRIDDAGIPIARRMPISFVLSATTIVSVLTMLNAATRITSIRISVIPSFSSLSAWNSELFCACQSSVRTDSRAASAREAPTSGATQRSFVATSSPVTSVPRPASSCATARETNRYWLSYSYMPVSNTPVTSSFISRGIGVPVTGLTSFAERGQRHRVHPGIHAEPVGEPFCRAPRRAACRQVVANRKSPAVAYVRIVVTGLPAPSGTIPMTNAPSLYLCPAADQRLRQTNGAAATTPGLRASLSSARAPSPSSPCPSPSSARARRGCRSGSSRAGRSAARSSRP